MLLETNRTLPSHRQKLAPPVWLLPKLTSMNFVAAGGAALSGVVTFWNEAPVGPLLSPPRIQWRWWAAWASNDVSPTMNVLDVRSVTSVSRISELGYSPPCVAPPPLLAVVRFSPR